jgi:hypothetical protein
MLTQKPPNEESDLEEAISDLFREMKSVNGDSKEYGNMTRQLVELYNLKSLDIPASKWPSPDTLALIAANLCGILLIVGFEHTGVITSKATTFVKKLL